MYEDFNYLGERVDKKIRRFKVNIFFLNFFYYFLFLLQIAAAASLPLLATMPESEMKNIIVSSCGIGMLICMLIFNSTNFKSKVQMNKDILHYIETEKYLYLNNSGKYTTLQKENAINLFASEIETTFNTFQYSKKRSKKKDFKLA